LVSCYNTNYTGGRSGTCDVNCLLCPFKILTYDQNSSQLGGQKTSSTMGDPYIIQCKNKYNPNGNDNGREYDQGAMEGA